MFGGCGDVVAIRIADHEIPGVGGIRGFEAQSGLQMDTVAQLQRVHDVAGRNPLLQVVVRGVRLQVGRPLIQGIQPRISGKIVRQQRETRYRTKIIASAIKVMIRECAKVRGKPRAIVRIVFRRIGILPLVFVADLPAKFQSRCMRSQMVIDPYRAVGLQIELSCLSKRQVDGLQ